MNIEEESNQNEHLTIEDACKQGLSVARFRVEQDKDPFVKQKILEIKKGKTSLPI